MPEEIRWIIDVIIAIAGIVIGYLGKTIQIKISNKKTDDHSLNVKGNHNMVAGRDINNGKQS